MEIHGFLQIVKVVLSQKFFTSLSVRFLKCGNSYLYLGHTILHAIVSHFHTEEPFSNETFDLHNVIKFLLQESSELYCTLFNNAYPKPTPIKMASEMSGNIFRILWNAIRDVFIEIPEECFIDLLVENMQKTHLSNK